VEQPGMRLADDNRESRRKKEKKREKKDSSIFPQSGCENIFFSFLSSGSFLHEPRCGAGEQRVENDFPLFFPSDYSNNLHKQSTKLNDFCPLPELKSDGRRGWRRMAGRRGRKGCDMARLKTHFPFTVFVRLIQCAGTSFVLEAIEIDCAIGRIFIDSSETS
jgi:hypothetical protein